MPDLDIDPRPASVGDETSPGNPAFGSPAGTITNDATLNAANAGRRQPISGDAHDANRAHLADHRKGWGDK